MTTGSQRWHLVLAVLYFVGLAALVFWPTPVDRPVDGLLLDAMRWLHRQGLPWWLVSYPNIEFAANIIVFIPMGVLVAWRLPGRWWWTAALIAAVVSGAIEGAQALILPERVPSVFDVLANTTGAAMGAVLILLVRFAVRPKIESEA